MNKFELISINEAKQLAGEPGYIVVDLRRKEDYAKNHIENAINIEKSAIDKIEQFNRKDLTWVLYCRRGSLSFQIASEMAPLGYKVMAVVGGFR